MYRDRERGCVCREIEREIVCVCREIENVYVKRERERERERGSVYEER